MNKLEVILDNCVRQMTEDGASVQACLDLYPQHANELKPLLEAAKRFEAARGAGPAYGYKVAARGKLMAQVATSRRRKPSAVRPMWRAAVTGLAVLVFMLLTTTAFAQAAFPGEPLYGWKLGSEAVWRVVSPDRLSVDLNLADRRAAEWTSVADDPERGGQAQNDYHEALGRLEAEMNDANGPEIDQLLKAHQKRFSEAGIRDEKLDGMVHGKGPKDK